MSRATPDRYHHGDLRRALIEAATVLLEERGASALSLREVARRAGVSHGAPAHHFRDKAGLLTAVATEAYLHFTGALQRAREAAGPEPIAALAATGRAYVHFAVQHRAYFELMFRSGQYHADDPALQTASNASYQVLIDAVIAAQEHGYAAGLDPRDVALSSWASVHGLSMLWLDGNLNAHFDMPLDDLIGRVLLTVGHARGS